MTSHEHPCHELDTLTANVDRLMSAVEKHGSTLYGNGTPGMDEQVRHLERMLDHALKKLGHSLRVSYGIGAVVLIIFGERVLKVLF